MFILSVHERLEARSQTVSPLSPVERGNEVEKTSERDELFRDLHSDCDWLLARENAKLCNNNQRCYTDLCQETRANFSREEEIRH